MNKVKNNVQLIGNLGMSPETRELTNAQKMAKFSIATHDSYIDHSGEKIQETQWHSLVAWGKVAEKAERLLSKGQEIALSGKIVTNSYRDKNGNIRKVTEIVVNDFVIVNQKKN